MRRYFAFAIATLPLFQHPENVKISIFPFTLSQQKCYISSKVFNEFWSKQRYHFLSIFLKDVFNGLRWLLWLKISSAQIFWFCNSNVTTFPTSRKCKNFNFSLYTVPAEMLYLQKYLTNFQKLFFGWKMRGRWLLWLKISSAQIFGFAIATLPLFQHPENVKISIFPFRLSQQKCNLFKSIFKSWFIVVENFEFCFCKNFYNI